MRMFVITGVLFTAMAFTAQAGIEEQRKLGLNAAERVYSSEDPETVIKGLSAEELKALQDVMTPGEVEDLIVPDDQLQAQVDYSGCYSRNAKSGRKALSGNMLYTYWQTTEVCVVEGKVTSVKITEADGKTHILGWTMARNPKKDTKNLGWEGRSNATYYFIFRGGGPWHVQHPTDCLQLRLSSNGRNSRLMKDCNLDAL